MLGSEVLSVRLGGIYALQRLAEERPEQYHIQIMRLLCAFVHLPARDQSFESGQVEIEPGALLGIRQDVEAVMQAIGSRAKSRIALERKAGFRLDLRGAELPRAEFVGKDLSNASFHHSNLSGANFANTDLSDAFFAFADLSGAMFEGMNFTRMGFSSANLSGAMLQDADLPMVGFHSANLSGAIFQDAIVANALLERANLSGAGFLRANLSGARLVNADLSSARFWDADLNKRDIADANLSGVEFSVGGPQTAKGLTQVQLDQARADPSNPPKLTGVLDAESGKPLVWRGKPLNDEA